MNISVSTLLDRLACPNFQRAGDAWYHQDVPDLRSALQGEALHALVESYVKGESVAAAFNLLAGAGEEQPLLIRDACNMTSFLNQLGRNRKFEAEQLLTVELPMSAAPPLHVQGYCDCLISDARSLVVLDWKPAPRLDGLDLLQVKLYLTAALTARGRNHGEWVVYYYRTCKHRRGVATLSGLREELTAAVQRAFSSERLRPGTNCTNCANRKGCPAVVQSLG